LEAIIKTASEDADKVAEFLINYQDELSKKAEDEMSAGVDPAAMMANSPMGGDEDAAMADAMAGGAPPAGDGGDDIAQLAAVLEQLGISPEELAAAMAGGGAASAEETASAAPGMEVEASAKNQGKKAAAKKVSADTSVRDYIQEVLERSRR